MRFAACVVLALALAARAAAGALAGAPAPLAPQCVGSWDVLVDSLSEPCVGALEFGVAAVNARSNDLSSLEPLEVLGGTQQVVAGVLYDLVVRCAPSSCLNDGTVHLPSDCEVDEGHASVWRLRVTSQPWSKPAFLLDGLEELSEPGAEELLAALGAAGSGSGSSAAAAGTTPLINAGIVVFSVALFAGGVALASRYPRRGRYEMV